MDEAGAPTPFEAYEPEPSPAQARCNLIVDSPCELPLSFCEKHGLFVMPYTYTMEGEAVEDDMYTSITPKQFYDAMRKGATPQTAYPDPLTFERVYSEALDAGKPVVYLCFSSGLSSAYDAACLAADRLKERRGADTPLYVVDLKEESTPQYLVCWEAVRQRDKGLSAKEMVQWAEEVHYYVWTLFMCDDLDALARGGRIPQGVAFVGTKLNVKPLLSIDLDGKLTLAGVSRGRKKGIQRLAEFYQEHHDRRTPIAGVGNADCPRDLELLKNLIRQAAGHDVPFLASSIGPTIGCHVGPGMISVCCWGPDRRESASALSVPDRIASEITSEDSNRYATDGILERPDPAE